ncbi:chromosome segregation protein ParM [Kitasatospora sp. NBC_01300]|uniref:chromosome segregation protein ParM n=1 Tax=Kitasatospora sp. NBC_01300 TaxID=2903574 RepID=UPI00352DE917|nr:chromosome segregation protein ParM [Kitasatospora sp. NBC_01300]
MAFAVKLERSLYLAAAPFLGAAASLPAHHPVPVTVACAGGIGVAASLIVVCTEKDSAGRWLVRLAPLTLAAAVDYAAYRIPGWGWDAALAGGWAWLCCAVVPIARTTGRYRRRRKALAAVPEAPVLTAAPQEEAPEPTDDGADPFTQGVRILWKKAGDPARTHVVVAKPHPGQRHDFTVLLRANEPGRPISGLRKADIAAAFGAHEDDIRLVETTQMAGRQAGPGWQEAEVIPDERHRRRTKPTTAEWWEDGIGEDAIPGSRYTNRFRDDERGVTRWTARLPDSAGEPRVDHVALARALGARHEDGRVFVDFDGRDVLVSVWDVSPLAKVYPATRELLTPDADGWYTTGYLANGQPARNRVHTDRGAAHGLFVAPSGGGKTQLMALAVCANAHWGAVIWLVTEAPDEKTAALGVHCDRYGVGPLYMVRALRALDALMEIRGTMPWADGKVHEWQAGKPGCPYRPLAVFWDEFLSAARDEDYGQEIMDRAESGTVKGRKYGIGENVAGQSIYVQDGFTQLLKENIRENSPAPVILKVAADKVASMFKALGIAPDNIPDPLPRSFSPEAEGRIKRILSGEAEPPSDSNTGGVGWIVPGRKPEMLRTLFIDFNKPIAPLFPDEVFGLTAHEIAGLEARGLWFDWTVPPRPGEFGDEPDEDDSWMDDEPKPARKSGAKGNGKGGGKGRQLPGRSNIRSGDEALAALQKLGR